jgi:putative ABC transport system ATP-binding protein
LSSAPALDRAPEHPAATAASLPLIAEDLRHAYQQGQPPVVDLGRLEVAPGATVALTGPSDSGKTTLAYLLTGIEPVRQSAVRWGGTDLARLSESTRDAWRRRHVGFVFQDFHLVPGLSILRNVLVSCYFDRLLRPDPVLVERAGALLDAFAVPTAGRGVGDLSRGKQQRVAVARALLRRPPVVVADEPTASLDATSGGRVIELLEGAGSAGATLLAVTHDPDLIAAVETVHRLERDRLDRVR